MGQFEENMKKSDIYTKIANAGKLGLMVTLTPKRAEITANTLLTMARTIDLLQKTIDEQRRALQAVPGFGEEYGVVPGLGEYEAPLQNTPKDYATSGPAVPRRTVLERMRAWWSEW